MRSFWSAISFSSSSSSSSSPSSSRADRPLKGKSKSSNDILKKAASNEQKRKLTRQKKLRHVTDDEVGLNSGGIRDGPQSWPVSPDSDSVTGSGAPTPLHGVACRQLLKFAVPQPLPRPEMGCQPKQNDGSPRHRTRVGGPASPADTRDPPRHDFGKTADGIVRETYVSTAYHRRGFQQELNVDISGNDFHLHFPAKSAPSSGPSSPVPSPQRYSTVDLFHPSFQVSSDRISKSHQISPIPTPEQTPLHSPTVQSPTKNGISRPQNVVNIHSHHKSHPENSAARADTNNLNVHPLPRPPAVCRQSPVMRHSIDRSDLSSVKGQWQRGKAVGRGTYGNVYIATHRETGATCAVKEVEMIPDDPKCAECMKQLEQEIKFLKELKHPNIVQYYGCEIIEDRFCIYLEYVHPGSVTKYVQEHCGVMTESIVRNFTRHILSGLAYLHGTKTIHRDIKGANLLVNAFGVVKLADFGLAKHLVGHDVDLSLKGTPHWMAPEVLQAAMRKDANPELAYGVDIWSVGCTVIEMLTGKPPWSECSPAQAMFNVLKKAPAMPQTLSAEGKDFLQWCFQRRPADRPSALKLLEHPFLRSSKDQNVAGVAQEFSGIKIHDLESSSEWTRRNKDVTPLSSATRIQQGKLPLLNASNETSRQSCPDSSDTGATPHHSPRCILEILPRVSSPELSSSFNSTSPLNVPNNLLLKDVNNNVCSFSSNGNLNLVLPKVVERKKQSSNVQKEIN